MVFGDDLKRRWTVLLRSGFVRWKTNIEIVHNPYRIFSFFQYKCFVSVSWEFRIETECPTEYIFYCKRAILFFSSSKILTPHPPLRPASVCVGSVCTPRLCCGGRTDSPGGERDGGSIIWKTREIGLSSYSKIWTLWNAHIGSRMPLVIWFGFIARLS